MLGKTKSMKTVRDLYITKTLHTYYRKTLQISTKAAGTKKLHRIVETMKNIRYLYNVMYSTCA